MNRSVLARIGPALFAFTVLAYAAFFAWAWFAFSATRFLPIYRAEQAARQALLLLLDWIVPLTAAAVVTALSLASGSAKHGGPALPFGQIVASAVLTFLVLAAGFTALSETLGAGSHRRLDGMAWQTKLAAQYKALAEKSRGANAWTRAVTYDDLYLQIDPGNQVVADQMTQDDLRASKENAGGTAAATAQAQVPGGVDAASLVKKAQYYFDREDWFSAHWYASHASQIDPRRADAARLAARALEKINGSVPSATQAADRAFFLSKKAAYDAFTRGETSTAYYALAALARERPADADVKEFLAKAEEALRAEVFFSDEAEMAAVLPGVTRLLWFNTSGSASTEVVWASRMVTIVQETKTDRYFLDLEAIRYDSSGAVAWHLGAPIARLSDDEKLLLLKSVDRTDAKKGTQAVYLAGSRPAAERNLLKLGVPVEDLANRSLDQASLSGTGMAELWRIRKSLPAGDPLRGEIAVELATRAAMPFVFLVVSLFAVAFGWSLRGRWTGKAPAFAWVAAPVIVASAGMLVQLYTYAHRVFLGFLVISLGLTATAIALGALELVLVATALAVLAGQSTA